MQQNKQPLPLNADAWNTVQVRFTDGQMTLVLNDTVVYTAQLSQPGPPTFGMFRYSGETGARVRNLTFTGDWPRTVPETQQQEFVALTIAQLNIERDALTDVFEHDFAKDGLPEKYFTTTGVRQHFEMSEDDGVIMKSICQGDWASGNVVTNFNIHGDFDISATYSNVQFDAPEESGARLNVMPADTETYNLRIGRLRQQSGDHQIKAMSSHIPRDGRIPKNVFHLRTEATSGKLRIVRRKNQYSYMFAEADSNVFSLAGTEIGPTDPLGVDGLHLSSMCLGRGTFSVCWKNLRIAAERLELRITEGATGPKALYGIPASAVDPENRNAVPLWRQYCEQRVQQFELFTAGEEQTAIERLPEPVMIHRQLNYSDGLIYLWKQSNGRPVAIGTMLLEDKNAEGGYREVDEFHSLHSGSLRMTDRGIEKWNVPTAGLVWNEIPAAPAPAATVRELFAQANELGQRFSCETRRRGGGGPPLLSKPIYTYTLIEDGNAIAGILTAFAMDANPEVLLSLEVRPNATGDLRWHYAGANYTGSNGYLLLDKKYVWQEAPAQFGERTPHRGWFPHKNLKPEDGIAATAPLTVRKVSEPPNGYTELGSPRWTSDGKRILFDARETPERHDTAQVAIVNADGKSPPKTIGSGMMPSMSLDGTQIVFCERGVMRMNADGNGREQLDASGWGVEWSPNGKQIAWRRGRQFVLMNVADGTTRNLLTAEQSSQIRTRYWNHAWSHDSKAIAFKAADRDGKNMIIVAKPDAPDAFQIVFIGETSEKLTWHPDNRQVCFSMNDPNTRLPRLFIVDPATDDPPQLLPGQPVGWKLVDCDWSPDGKWIAFSGEPAAQTQEWPLIDSNY